MASPLSEMQIGSPLPDHKQLLADQLKDGVIEFMSDPKEIDACSTVTLRSTSSIGFDALNGSWCYTPKYTYENRHPVSYTFGHMQDQNVGGYSDIMRTMVQKAEQEFYYGPMGLVRKFLIQHEAHTGKTDLMLPHAWSVVIDSDLKIQDFMGIIEGYVHSEQRQIVASAVYEKFYANSENTSRPVRIVCSTDTATVMPVEATAGSSAFDMTAIFRFISNPKNHGLTQEIFRAYRKLVNL